MIKKHSKFWEIVLVFVGIIFLASVKAIAVGTLIPIASAIYDSGTGDDKAGGVTVDSENNIIVTGTSYNGTNYDYLTIKYDSNFVVLSSATYNSLADNYEHASGVVVDNNGNVIVTGSSNNGSDCDYFTIKYDQDLSVVLSSATYNGIGHDYALGITLDNDDNIIVTGFNNIGTTDLDYFTIKYNSNLVVISSAVYSGYSTDYGFGVAVDKNNNIIVTGVSSGLTTLKYDKNFVLLSSATYNGAGQGVVVDEEGNIIVTGSTNDGSNDCITIKYSQDFTILSSARYENDAYSNNSGQGVDIDAENNIIVAGWSGQGVSCNYFTVKYDKNLKLLSSATYKKNGENLARGVAVDNNGNIIVTGKSFNGTDYDFFTIKYLGSPKIQSVYPVSGKCGESLDVTINGINFYNGVTVSFDSSGIVVNSVNLISSTVLKANITINSNADFGNQNVIVKNIDEISATKFAAFKVLNNMNTETGEVKIQGGEKGYVNPAKGEQATIHFRTERIGEIKIRIYTLKGQLVWEKSKESNGEEDFILWNCNNSYGTVISSGIYIIHINGSGINTTKKIAILK